MAIIYGQIDSFSRLYFFLRKNDIKDLNSIEDVQRFQDNYAQEVKLIENRIEIDYSKEYKLLKTQQKEALENLEEHKIREGKKLQNNIDSRKKKIQKVESKYIKNDFLEFFNWCYGLFLRFINWLLEKNYERIIAFNSISLKRKEKEASIKIYNHKKNKESIIKKRLNTALSHLNKTKRVLDQNNLLIAGAIGENLVVKEISKLSNDFVLFNDFNLKFKPPIFNRNENDRIYSMQADHVLVCKGGVFVIETKNWSRLTIDNYNMRSPIEQVRRSGYALFTLLNSRRNKVLKFLHQWGRKTIPVKNIVVMVRNKPNAGFENVEVLNLSELNRYLRYVNPIFSDEKMQSVVRQIRKLGNYS